MNQKMFPSLSCDSQLDMIEQGVTPGQIQEAYWQQLQRYHHQPTPLTEMFFSTLNIQRILREIENRLSDQMGELIEFIPTEEFTHLMLETAHRNRLHSYRPAYGLPIMNEHVISVHSQEVGLQMRHRQRYIRQQLLGDRLKVFPLGLNDKVMHVKGENQVDTSQYMNRHPWGKQHHAFLSQVLGNSCPQSEYSGLDRRLRMK